MTLIFCYGIGDEAHSFQFPSARSGGVRFATLPEGFSSTFEPDIVPPQADDLLSLLAVESQTFTHPVTQFQSPYLTLLFLILFVQVNA